MTDAEQAVQELQTMGDFVRWGASMFIRAGITYGHGTDNALDEAYALVRHALHLPHDIPAYMINGRLTQAERESVAQVLSERVSSRKPAAYLTNESLFAGIPFFVDERVLIPRSPVAELIENQFEPWIHSADVFSILDLCTGSGCIAIACAMMFPDANVVATDKYTDALDVAAINVERHGLNERVQLVRSDVFDTLDANTRFNIIISNPPYVNADDMAVLEKEFEHEPAHALAAGDDGLDIVRQILKQASDYLADSGLLVVEVGNSAEALIKAYPELPFIWPEFERGGGGVFILSKRDLDDFLFS